MKFKAEIDVMPLDALLDPQGKAVSNSMGSVGLPEIEGVEPATPETAADPAAAPKRLPLPEVAAMAAPTAAATLMPETPLPAAAAAHDLAVPG